MIPFGSGPNIFFYKTVMCVLYHYLLSFFLSVEWNYYLTGKSFFFSCSFVRKEQRNKNTTWSKRPGRWAMLDNCTQAKCGAKLLTPCGWCWLAPLSGETGMHGYCVVMYCWLWGGIWGCKWCTRWYWGCCCCCFDSGRRSFCN